MNLTLPEQDRKTVSRTLLFGLTLLSLAGLGVWCAQLIQGMQVIGLGQHIVWSGYIAGFFTAAAAGAGLLTIASLNVIRPFVSERMQRKLLALSLSCFTAAGVMITFDVGYPANIWHLMVAGAWTSLMTWDFWLLSVTAFFCAASVLFIKSRRMSFLLAVTSIPSALMLVIVEAWMLSTMAARPEWSGSHLVVNFLISAGIGGTALAVYTLPVDSTQSLRRWLRLFIGVNLVLLSAELLNGLISPLHFPVPVMIHALAGVALPFWLLSRQNPLFIRIAAILAVCGVFLEKTVILTNGQATPWLALPSENFHLSAAEMLALAGSVAMGALMYLVLQRIISNVPDLNADDCVRGE